MDDSSSRNLRCSCSCLHIWRDDAIISANASCGWSVHKPPAKVLVVVFVCFFAFAAAVAASVGVVGKPSAVAAVLARRERRGLGAERPRARLRAARPPLLVPAPRGGCRPWSRRCLPRNRGRTRSLCALSSLPCSLCLSLSFLAVCFVRALKEKLKKIKMRQARFKKRVTASAACVQCTAKRTTASHARERRVVRDRDQDDSLPGAMGRGTAEKVQCWHAFFFGSASARRTDCAPRRAGLETGLQHKQQSEEQQEAVPKDRQQQATAAAEAQNENPSKRRKEPKKERKGKKATDFLSFDQR